MSVNPATFIRKLVSLPHTMVEAIEDFRFQNRCKSEAEAIRRLIDRGLKRDLPPDRAVTDPDRAIAPTGAVADVKARSPAPPGPYPWETTNVENVVRYMNVSLPGRLKMQLDWLAHETVVAGKSMTLRQLVIDGLTGHVEAELRARGIDP